MDSPAWHRWTDEPEIAYAAFTAYVQLAYPSGLGGGPQPRLLPVLARRIGKEPSWLRDCLHTWHWRERAHQYDQAVRRAQDAAVADQAYDATREILGAVDVLTRAVVNEAQKLLERSTTDENVMNPRELAKMLEVLNKTKQLLSGGATERVEVGGMDLDSLSAEELLELSRLIGKGEKK